jgi:hypothetical protein
MKGLLSLNWTNIKSALVYGVLMVAVTFSLVALALVIGHGSIFGVDWRNVVDKGAIAALGVIVTMVSLLKNFLTDNEGKFLGMVEVIPDKK